MWSHFGELELTFLLSETHLSVFIIPLHILKEGTL